MAPVPVEPLAEHAVSSSRRARELYKYFVPSAFCTTRSSDPDTVLTAHAQLVAWRLNCQRAMVSLIDRETQYFVAESTKTLHLDDSALYEEPSDAIWAGCVSVPKAGRLCEHTIQQLPTNEGDPAYFEVLDLTKDDRFNTLPFVTAAPSFKYYCGVPLRTKKGIAIGSLFALDDKVREPISRTNKMFLATMAENVMSHYENMREKEDRKRVLHMNMCLAAFVDPEHQLKRRKRRHPSLSKSNSRSRKSGLGATASEFAETIDTTRAHKESSSTQSQRSSRSRHSSDARSEDSASTFDRRVEEDDNIETFRRAADLLNNSLSLDGSGGVVFLDTATSYRSKHWQRKASDESSDGGDSDQSPKFTRRGSMGTATLRSASSWGPPRVPEPPEMTPAGSKPADIIACSPALDKLASSNVTDFSPLSHDAISKLIKRHPRGKLFNLDPEAVFGSSSSGEEFPTYDVPKARKLTPSKSEALILSKHFPGARQIIFLPLWDATASRFSTFFAYSTSEFRTFSNNPDFLYCIAFCNCVMTEITRLATLAADQQKSDFIGSVSHELRSPLHGILASCEFLGDTETSSFQKSLIDTADSCARTLLDTINMVLDYSKINAFERNAKKRKRRGDLNPNLAQSGQPQLNIYGDVDLAAITEEVVEGVATGQVFKDSLTGVDAVDLSGDASRQSFAGRKDVEIILDIVPRESPKDWVFITQPGAFRRIIMNIFGNALKYTRRGFIRIKLEAHSAPKHHTDDSSEQTPTTLIKLTITDTGQGMSSQFMRTKLYTPFAQENSIAPGTGLGLSLVKSMVTMLNGEINIQSAQNVGTEVIVQFPMTLSSTVSSSGSASGSTPTSGSSIERVKDDSLLIVQQKVRGRRAMLFPGTSRKVISEATRMVRDAINRYLTGWFRFEAIQSLSRANAPDVIISDEADLPDLLKILPDALEGTDGPMIVVLCTAASRRSDKKSFSKSSKLEVVSHPFGPYKLARSIRFCLERLERNAVIEVEAETQAVAAAEDSKDFGIEEVITAVEQVTIENPDPDVPDVNVIQHGKILAHEDSVHAQLVVESGQVTESSQSGSQDKLEFPFPVENDGTISPSNLDVPESGRPALTTRRTISTTQPELAAHQPEPAAPVSRKGAIADSPTEDLQSSTPAPRLLLVDDNKVNLRLLQTFMKKRKYMDVFSAEDGHQAVSLYRDLLSATPPRPPDIIFMDISMPVMNGFEATRTIRKLESEFRDQFASPMETPNSALIIALTGLASGRDQSEAFTSGFDLYLVKPISFREVGRLLDNWEKNGGAATVGVPHGAVTGDTAGSASGG